MRLAYFVSHPIQYQAPLLRVILQDSDIEQNHYKYTLNIDTNHEN